MIAREFYNSQKAIGIRAAIDHFEQADLLINLMHKHNDKKQYMLLFSDLSAMSLDIESKSAEVLTETGAILHGLTLVSDEGLDRLQQKMIEKGLGRKDKKLVSQMINFIKKLQREDQ